MAKNVASVASPTSKDVEDNGRLSVTKIIVSRKKTKSFSRIVGIILSDGNMISIGWQNDGSMYSNVSSGEDASRKFSIDCESYEIKYNDGTLSVVVPDFINELMGGVEIEEEEGEKKPKGKGNRKLDVSELPPEIVEEDYIPSEKQKRGRKPKTTTTPPTLSKSSTESCPDHPNYHGKRKPVNGCKKCWEMYKKISPKLAEKC
jgi:hypothetical protein